MEILYPMAISAVAVLVTLLYASFLDIRYRRVPFIHWLPMLGIGVVSTSYLLWQTTADISLITGYIAVVVCFLYADYLDEPGKNRFPRSYRVLQEVADFLLSFMCSDPSGSFMVRFHTFIKYSAHSLVFHVCGNSYLYFV